MRKALILISLLALIGAGVLLFRRFVGDIRPAFLPPREEVEEVIEAPEMKTGESGFSIRKGFGMEIFAKGLGSPRDLQISPQGTLLVSIPSQGKVVALPDKNQDGQADEIVDVLTGLDRPHGLAFYTPHNSESAKLFVAEETRVVRYGFNERGLEAKKDKELFTLPRGGRHYTRTIAFNQDGDMFVSLGSTCDTCFENHPWLAAVIVSDSKGEDPRLFAAGLRNSVFIKVHPQTQELWGTEMGRDFLGDFLPPDEINIIRERVHYGWPVCYGDKAYDKKFGQKSPEYCKDTISPIYEIVAHSAPLGLTFIDSEQFPDSWQGDLLVAYHGSWNRSTPIGYKMVRLKVEENEITGEEDFISGFLKDSNSVGRPVDPEFGLRGELYISDDKAGVVYLVTGK